MIDNFRTTYNATAMPFSEVPELELNLFLDAMLDATRRGWRVASYFAVPDSKRTILISVLTNNMDGQIGVARTIVAQESFPSIASLCPQVSLFEREIAEQCGIVPEGHPWFKPVRFHHSFVPGRDAWHRPSNKPVQAGVMDYYQVEGHEVHEVAVGPVHAGIIEPGHFRFQCHGEQVFHLEISLGYQHRGIERGLLGGPAPRAMHQMETIAGDTTIGHGQAYCMIIEALAGLRIPARAQAIRGIALELERLANHTGDLGAIAADVGYLPTASFCGRIRGDFLNMTAGLCGSRFGRGMLCPGGTNFDITAELRDDLLGRLASARTDLTNAVELLWTTQSVMGRLEGTGPVDAATATTVGLVGPAARACGLKRDVRHNNPFGIFLMAQIPMVTGDQGDVCARTIVRWLEAQKSMDFVEEQLRQLPVNGHKVKHCSLAADRIAIAMTEGWRGEICHIAVTDAQGRFLRYKVTDPSFHNWQGLAIALRGQQISDFPLCNKSFNLSYCGVDL